MLKPVVSAHPNLYVLSNARDAAMPSQPKPRAAVTAPTLIVSPLHAAAGFDSKRIIYIRQADQLEYFAHSEWIDTPARMLAPLIVTAVERSGAFRAVVQTPSTVAGEMRLDIEILRLQHEFLSAPSHVRLTLRAYLVDSKTRRVIASIRRWSGLLEPDRSPARRRWCGRRAGKCISARSAWRIARSIVRCRAMRSCRSSR